MSNPKARYSCPVCGFFIFNRRVKNCESCKVALPENLLFTNSDLARLQKESAENEKIRADMARDAQAEQMRNRAAGDLGPFPYIDLNG